MDTKNVAKLFNTINDKISDSTKLVIKDNLGLVYEGTIESFNCNIVENRDEILNSEIIDSKFNQENNELEIILA